MGDNKGSVGVGLGKARGIPDAIRKAEDSARKNMFKVSMIGATIPHNIVGRWGTAEIVLRPAAPGTGVKAGGAVRACLEACGIHDVLAKSLGSRNATNMAYATINAFEKSARERRWVGLDEVPGAAEATGAAAEGA